MTTYETMKTVETIRQLSEAIAKIEALISAMDMVLSASNYNNNLDDELITKQRSDLYIELRRLSCQLKETERKIQANI